MSKYGGCNSCGRRYRSKAVKEAAEAFRYIHEALRREIEIDRQPDKTIRHRAEREDFRAHG